MNLHSLSAAVQRPDPETEAAAEQYRLRLPAPAGALGQLDALGAWLASVQERCPTEPIARPRVIVLAGDHGVAAAGVSAHTERGTTTLDLVRAVLDGAAPVNVLARTAGDVPVRVVDICLDADPEQLPPDTAKHRVRRGSGRIDHEDACTLEEADAAFAAGMALADEEADSGTDLVLLGDLGVGSTTGAAVLVAALCGVDASVVTGRGSGIDDYAWMHKCAAIRDALRRARPVLGEPMELLAAVGGPQLAALSGFLLQSAVRRLPVVLDGVVAAAAALVVQRIAHRATDWWRAATPTGEPAQDKALERMLIEPLMQHKVHTGGGAAAVLTVPLLKAAAAALAELPAAEPVAEKMADGPDVDAYDAT
ncbi:nicotinate-nucleotide--dimethylbenzimidazole phosphoribosyltransferase [Mangrovactinospora gilvigrisea]|uniref:Nicotinate-nucleotide--dimethylbenzimidazole phosphoribosyltransferase n=1 Tax=Mangrovactinospora gilvigrisea TaxID=1428644 RepID=A0A1J7C7Q3_9ACTN|nr:nicotinate-nucleotide--dimethylbenzimidazole phosphoribosyltransferase [Mangrovactinospora gilvigrisea]OIV37564.1 nicotinate-nucleotide--dimethylbenzimidazole phosphoribosyltransferase [Mangrovactinospora gilvigrisea]